VRVENSLLTHAVELKTDEIYITEMP